MTASTDILAGTAFRSAENGLRILVVDDEEHVRAIIRERLQIAGFAVDEAVNGRDAMDRAGRERYAVLLTDIRMPVMDGIGLLREWMRRYPDTAAIVMSAYAELDTAVAALKIGACDYITKPFNFDVLLITIESALRKKAVERQLQDYQVNLERKVQEQTELINAMYAQSIQALIQALEAKDHYTRGHSQRVTMYSVAIGKAMELAPERIEILRRAAVLHDLGKIGIPEAILNKPARLSPREFEAVTRHPEMAAAILQHVVFFQPLLPAILHHHERYDGMGYPAHLSGNAIPLESRIMAVADTFDAMTSTRAYREALPLAEANAEVIRCAGSQFDPEIVPVFLKIQGRIEVPRDVLLPEGLDTRIFVAQGSPAR
ncbi:MAG: response regulator [Deltaproteobacteria bacterium]|nr:response regulator [Deltaproteobacteria bacterium]